MKLTDLGEKEIIRRLSSFLDIGDDAAYIKYGDEYLVLTTDMIYEETHQLPGMTPEQMGKFVVSVNASDIAAMGAKPLAFLLAYGGPDMDMEKFEAMIHAVDDQCTSYGLKFAGGDTKQAGKLTLTGFAIGTAKRPVLRSGAKAGDLLAVTGTLGEASLGADVLLRSLKYPLDNPVIRKAMEPEARIKEGMVLGDYATSMADISDSLALSMYDISNMSDVGITLDIDKIPVSDDAVKMARDLKLEIMDYALYGGGDYELLFSIKKEDYPKIAEKIRSTVIGEVTNDGVTGTRGGKSVPVEKRGYEHFRKKK